MTRKDYNFLAGFFVGGIRGINTGISNEKSSVFWEGYSVCLEHLCAGLGADNANFDARQFMDYITHYAKGGWDVDHK